MTRTRVSVVAMMLCMVLLVGCAVQRTQAPQISPATAWELNTADQLSQLEQDYKDVFTQVGEWQRKGQITPAQVDAVNVIGHRLQPAIENANRVFKSWQTTRDASQKLQATNLVLEATNIFTELVTAKAKIATGGN